MYNEKTGNYSALAGTHLSFPTGKGIIFGEGYRIFGEEARDMGYNHSDIGYVNDMFMGGMIYISILYGSIFRFLRRKPRNGYLENKQEYILQSLIPKQLIIALLIANYKGEVMRGGSVLLVAIFIKLVLLTDITKELGRKYG